MRTYTFRVELTDALGFPSSSEAIQRAIDALGMKWEIRVTEMFL